MGACFDGMTVNVNSAGAAMACFAADMGAREIEFFAQEVNEQGAWFDGLLMRAAVDLKGDELFGHGIFLGVVRWCEWVAEGGVGGSRWA